MGIPPVPPPNPGNETKTNIAMGIDDPGSILYTYNVTFKPKVSLNSQALTDNTGISESQVCMSTGDYSEGDGFRLLLTEAKHLIILYEGIFDKTVRILVICDVNEDSLNDDFEAYADKLPSNLPDCTDACSKGTCCAVMLTKPK